MVLVLVNDRRCPVNLEPYGVPTVRWRAEADCVDAGRVGADRADAGGACNDSASDDCASSTCAGADCAGTDRVDVGHVGADADRGDDDRCAGSCDENKCHDNNRKSANRSRSSCNNARYVNNGYGGNSYGDNGCNDGSGDNNGSSDDNSGSAGVGDVNADVSGSCKDSDGAENAVNFGAREPYGDMPGDMPISVSRYRVVVVDDPLVAPTGKTDSVTVPTKKNDSVATSAGQHDLTVSDTADGISQNGVTQSHAANGGVVWDSGVIDGDGYSGVPLTGLDTSPSKRYWVSVALWDGQDRCSWTSPVTFGTGAGNRWIAQPIWSPPIKDAQGRAQHWAFLRTAWTLPNIPVRWATLNVTAASTEPARQFVYRLWLDGIAVGCGPVFPEGNEARYDGYDVTEMLQHGRSHAIGVISYTTADHRFAAQLDVGFADGTVRHYGTGSDWRALGYTVYGDAPSIGTSYFDAPAEYLDATRFPYGFSTADYDDSDWLPAVVRLPFACTRTAKADAMVERVVNPAHIRIVNDDHIAVDFGRMIVGGIRLDIDTDRPIELTIRYGEELNPDGTARYRLRAGNVYEDKWRFPAGRHALATWGIRVFRYVDIIPNDRCSADPSCTTDDGSCVSDALGVSDVACVSDALCVSDISCAEVLRSLACTPGHVTACALEQPHVAEEGSFSSSDAVLTRVWEFCRGTVDAANANIYVDSWTRERAPYEADAWVQQRAHLALDDAPALGRASVDWLAARRTWPTEWPLYTILAVHDSWMHTGSLDQASRLYDQLVRLLPDRYLDADSGLIVKDPGQSSHMDGDLVDWPESERDGFVFGRVNTVINALASQAYADMADLAQGLGHNDDSRRFREISKRMREAIHSTLYDAERGAYRDGLSEGPQGAPIDHCSLHASAFVLAFAQVPYERITPVGAFLRSRGMACSVYTAAVYLGGLYSAGLGADANRLIGATDGVRTWSHMITLGAGGTMEAWDPELKPNTTFSHPWAASPAYLLPTGLLGIRPLEPGWRTIAIVPQPGGVQQAQGSLPARSGRIAVSWAVHNDFDVNDVCGDTVQPISASLDVVVPPECNAVVVPPATLPTDGGVVRLSATYADGTEIEVATMDRPFAVANVWCDSSAVARIRLGTGKHHIALQYV